MRTCFRKKFSDTTDYLIEGAIRALLVNADKLIANQKDVNVRGEIQWLASVAHGGFLDAGRRADWGSHRIEHELSAQYNITHGEGMAVVTVAWTKYMAEKKPWRLALLASRVFGVDSFNYSETERALILSEKLAAFFKKLGLATTLADLKIGDKDWQGRALRAAGCCRHQGNLENRALIKKASLKIVFSEGFFYLRFVQERQKNASWGWW